MNLLVITISDKDYENIQIQKASKFLETNKDTIITCREQQIELINSILKYKRKECNRKLKESGQKGIGSVKEFRHYEEFNQAVDLCKMIYNDMLNFAQIDNNFSYDIDCIIEHLSEADINDYMYLKYCLDILEWQCSRCNIWMGGMGADFYKRKLKRVFTVIIFF